MLLIRLMLVLLIARLLIASPMGLVVVGPLVMVLPIACPMVLMVAGTLVLMETPLATPLAALLLVNRALVPGGDPRCKQRPPKAVTAPRWFVNGSVSLMITTKVGCPCQSVFLASAIIPKSFVTNCSFFVAVFHTPTNSSTTLPPPSLDHIPVSCSTGPGQAMNAEISPRPTHYKHICTRFRRQNVKFLPC